MASDQKKWYGVLIEHGYFDEMDRYSIAGVVDHRSRRMTSWRSSWKQFKADAEVGGVFHSDTEPARSDRHSDGVKCSIASSG